MTAIGAAAIVARTSSASATVTCFLAGTQILTRDGTRTVESLSAGDRLPTHFRGAQQVEWVGRYSLRKSEASRPWQKRALPVKIARDALGPNVPSRDLYVSQAHAIYLDEVLVPAGDLVNGTTISLFEPADPKIDFFHIKLARHDVIWAEGAPVETLLQVDERSANFADYYRQFGMPSGVVEACAPILSFDGGRSELTSRLRSTLSPWIDRRTKLDRIRDRLEDRALA